MDLEYLTIFLLILISVILSLLFIKSLRTKNAKEDLDIINIKEQLNSLLHKTMEQSGYMNSKIDEIGDLTKKMTSAMTANISDMGQMGEVILENILENCGMTKDRDYKTQFSGKIDEGNNLRPDVVIFLPENRNIIIDSKVPMKDWYQYQNSDENKVKEKSIFNFISSIKNHINSIHKKDYKNSLKEIAKSIEIAPLQTEGYRIAFKIAHETKDKNILDNYCKKYLDANFGGAQKRFKTT